MKNIWNDISKNLLIHAAINKTRNYESDESVEKLSKNNFLLDLLKIDNFQMQYND